MIKNDMTIKIGGEAGQGVASSGAGLAKTLSRGGLHLFSLQDYMSRIRGGHNFSQLKVSEKPLYAHSDEIHLLLALVPETIERHKDELVPGGGIIYDEDMEVDAEDLVDAGLKPFPVPLVNIAEQVGSKIMTNTAALGAATGVTDYDLKYLNNVLEQSYKKKGHKVVDANQEVARKAYDYVQEHYAADFEFKLEPIESPDRMVINGNHAFCLGAVMGGCRFISAYPMTPATSIIEWMSTHADRYGIVAKHTEDELAAILMAIGANHAGVRAMTSTSGGGFSLMVESLGLAGITETPLVAVDVQRVGPSTGMPTRSEQADLLFMLRASQGEFPRFVLAPGTPEEAFNVGWRAFNLAEKYQCPVIVLSDTFLANSLRTIEREDFGFEEVEIDRGELLTDEELDKMTEEYKRYALTKSGISPRAIPGHPNAVFMASSDEHTEDGHIEDEDPVNRVQMADKRLRKMETMITEMRAPTQYGPADAETTFVCWGSSYGPVREAVDRFNQDGDKANLLHFTDIFPFPSEKAQPLLDAAKRLIDVESNATAQFATLLRTYADVNIDETILRYDGQPLSPDYILARV